MKIFDLKTMQQCKISENTVVALGTFDGCHMGHTSVLTRAFLEAKRLKAKLYKVSNRREKQKKV